MMLVVAGNSDRRGSVFIAEQDDGVAGDGGLYLTGTFTTSWQTPDRIREVASGLSSEAAIRWGRQRTDSVFIRLGVGDYYWAGIGQGPPGAPRWPPPDLPALTRRRHPDFAYLDRAPDDPEIEWEVTLWLGPQRSADTPPGLPVSPGVDAATIAAIADRAGATWDSDARDELLADLDRARRAATRRGQRSFGWATFGRDAYRLRLCVSAPSEELGASGRRRGSRCPLGCDSTK